MSLMCTSSVIRTGESLVQESMKRTESPFMNTSEFATVKRFQFLSPSTSQTPVPVLSRHTMASGVLSSSLVLSSDQLRSLKRISPPTCISSSFQYTGSNGISNLFTEDIST